MRKTIYLHIGHYKTGTTALQVFLNSNRDALQNLGKLWSKGVDYPDQFSHFAKHSQMAFSIYREAGMTRLMYGYSDETPAKERWNSFFDYVRKSKCPSILISSEEFMRMGANPKAAQLLQDIVSPVRNEFNFKIIAYLRHPDAHLRSWYNQLVKLKQPVPDFNRTVCEVMEPIHYDYNLALKPWKNIFGEKSLIVRPYTESLRQDGALFKDFMDCLGVPFDPQKMQDWHIPIGDVNPRLSEKSLELTRIAQNLNTSKEVIDWLQSRYARVYETHRADDTGPTDFHDVVERSRAGLEALKASPETSDLATLYSHHLPAADTSEYVEMVSFAQLLMQENLLTRNKMNENAQKFAKRLAAIEAKLDLSKTDKK